MIKSKPYKAELKCENMLTLVPVEVTIWATNILDAKREADDICEKRSRNTSVEGNKWEVVRVYL